MDTAARRFIILVISMLYLSETSGVTIEPRYATYYVLEPRPLNMTCTSEEGNSSVWYKGSTEVKKLGFNIKVKQEGRIRTAAMTKAATSTSDSGKYRCQNGGKSDSRTINVQVVKVTSTNAEYSPGQVSATLVCSLDNVDSIVYNRSWEFGAVKLQDDDKFVINKENSSLIIKTPGPSDGGVYVCVNDFNNQILTVPINFFVPPSVKKPNRSMSLTVGDPLSLQCSISSHPQSSISWLKNGQSVTGMERVVVLDDDGQQNGLLTINSTQLNTTGTYTCVVYSQYFNMTAEGYFEVKVTRPLKSPSNGASVTSVTSVCYILTLSTLLILLTSSFGMHCVL